MPHWTDPPTGEVPRILPGDDAGDEPGRTTWQPGRPSGHEGHAGGAVTQGTTGTTSTRSGCWPGDDEPVGALDQTRTEHSDLYSFDEDFERVEAERSGSVPGVTDFDDEFEPETGRHPGRRPPRRRRGPATPGPAALGRPAARASVARRPPEAATRILPSPGGRRRRPHRPADRRLRHRLQALVALAAAHRGGRRRRGVRDAAAVRLPPRHPPRPGRRRWASSLGAYWKGLEALPLVDRAGLRREHDVVPAAHRRGPPPRQRGGHDHGVRVGRRARFLRRPHAAGPARQGPASSGRSWSPSPPTSCAFLVGRWIGSRPMAPSISPSKTVEGFVGGLVGGHRRRGDRGQGADPVGRA